MNKEKDLTTFVLAFENQNVIITTNLTTNQTAMDQSGMPLTESLPLFYEGILLDYDEEYYYLGETNNPNEITQAIKKINVVHIMTNETKDPYETMLDQLPFPKNKEDVN